VDATGVDATGVDATGVDATGVDATGVDATVPLDPDRRCARRLKSFTMRG
jgi:hypothetical protein